MKKITMPKRNIIDRAIWAVAPQWAMRRERARFAGAYVAGYTGGSRVKRSMKEWIIPTTDADSIARVELATLRTRSRDLCRNSSIASGAIKTVLTNVIGPGLKLKSSIDRDYLNIDDEVADLWEANAEREFKLWADSYECDITRKDTFYELQKTAFRSVLESGDLITSLPFKERGRIPYGLKIQLIEADRLCNENYAADTDRLIAGVEKDNVGAPIRYHILNGHPGNSRTVANQKWTKVKAFNSRGRQNVIHLYVRLRPGQTRGIPYFAPVMEALKQLDRYGEAELAAAVVSAYFTVFITSETGDMDFEPIPTDTDSPGGGRGDVDTELKLGQGALLSLNPNEDIKIANPGRPNEKFDPFVKAILQQVGTSLGMPFEVLIKHFTASYSASRASMLEAWKFFGTTRLWFSRGFNHPIYEAFMDEAVARNRIVAPGYFKDPLIRRAYLGSSWIGPSKGMIDEYKEIQAAEKRISLGITTLEEETAQLTGGEWLPKLKQRAKEEKLKDEMGLKSQPPQQPPALPGREEEEDEEGEEREGSILNWG